MKRLMLLMVVVTMLLTVGCSNNNTKYDYKQYDESQHYVMVNTLIDSLENHVYDENKVCVRCGFINYEELIYYPQYDEYQHYRKIGTKGGELENHIYDENKVCVSCGYSMNEDDIIYQIHGFDFKIGYKDEKSIDYDGYYVVGNSDKEVTMYHTKDKPGRNYFYQDVEIYKAIVEEQLYRELAKRAYYEKDGKYVKSDFYIETTGGSVDEAIIALLDQATLVEIEYPRTTETDEGEMEFANWYEEYEWQVENNY